MAVKGREEAGSTGGRQLNSLGARVGGGATRKSAGSAGAPAGSSKVTRGQALDPEMGWTFRGKAVGGEPIWGLRSSDLDALAFEAEWGRER